MKLCILFAWRTPFLTACCHYLPTQWNPVKNNYNNHNQTNCIQIVSWWPCQPWFSLCHLVKIIDTSHRMLRSGSSWGQKWSLIIQCGTFLYGSPCIQAQETLITAKWKQHCIEQNLFLKMKGIWNICNQKTTDHIYCLIYYLLSAVEKYLTSHP